MSIQGPGGYFTPPLGAKYGTSLLHVYSVSNKTSQAFQDGNEEPPVVTAESANSSILLIDSRHQENRNETTSSNSLFLYGTNSEIWRARKIQVVSMTIPSIPNINLHNNNVAFHVDTGGAGTEYSFSITPGWYIPSNMCAVLAMGMAAESGLTWNVTYDDITRSITISNTSSLRFYFVLESTFIQYARLSVPLPAAPRGSDPTTYGAVQVKSGRFSMMYTRHVFVNSPALTKKQFDSSHIVNDRIDDATCIAVINMSQYYDNISASYNGSGFNIGGFLYVNDDHNPIIDVATNNRALGGVIEIRVSDEYGFLLSGALPRDTDDGSGALMDYSRSQNDFISIIVKVTY